MKLVDDLEHIYKLCRPEFEAFDQKTLYITGGTGFFGKWLLETIVYVNELNGLKIKCIVLSRDPAKFLADFPQFNRQYIQFDKGDITDFSFPEEEIDYIFHMATAASVSLNLTRPLLMFDVVVEGTKRVLQLANEKRVKAVLLTSSGAVYGQQPGDIERVPETYMGGPDVFNKNAAYGEGKRVAEMLANFYHLEYGVNVKIARCFAFVGPYLPLDSHFAIGNFIKNVLEGNDIFINGDGRPYRSYMYASDLMVWLIKILFNAKAGDPVNVGSDRYLTIKELAQTILNLHPDCNIKISIAQKEISRIVQRYVPSIDKAKSTLGLTVSVSLEESITKTVLYHKKNSNQK